MPKLATPLTDVQVKNSKPKDKTWTLANQRDHDKPMSGDAIRMALNRMGYEGKMTTHGFRALAMTTLKERLGYRHETVDRQLANAQRTKSPAPTTAPNS
jgi:hypothetical protein